MDLSTDSLAASIPISALYVSLLALLLVGLSARVVQLRASTGTIFGMAGDGGENALNRAIRAQANFTEYAPIAALLLVVVEVAGYSALWIHSLGGLLVLGRLLHAQGFSREGGASFGRVAGTLATFIVIAVGSGLTLYAAASA